MRPLQWVVAGGGTGGHVTPALALAERIVDRGDHVLLLGSDRGLESRLVPAAGFDLVALPSRQIMGRGIAHRLLAIPAMARACAAAYARLGRFGAEIVVSVGGYASVPAVAAAALRRLPVALVEPNAIPGRANRLAARFARRVFVQFDEAGARLGAADRTSAVGIPLRRGLVDAFESTPQRRAARAPFRLLVFGGSQGARQLNDAMIEAAPALAGRSIEIFHQTGDDDRERVAGAYRVAGVAARVEAFEPDMPQRYRWADVALCRAGALTVAELAMAGLPALLVPFPFAADDHQTANARALSRAGAARVLSSRPLDVHGLLSELDRLFAAPDELTSMSAAATKLARPRAADQVIDECAALARAGKRE